MMIKHEPARIVEIILMVLDNHSYTRCFNMVNNMKNPISPVQTFALLIILISLGARSCPAADSLRTWGGANPHFLSNSEWEKWRVLCAKIDNEINSINRRINVLQDLKNRHAKADEMQAMAAAIRSGIDEIFNEVNTEMCDRKLFVEDSKVFMAKLVGVKHSLENLGKF